MIKLFFITDNNELAVYDLNSKLINKKEISYPINNINMVQYLSNNRKLYGVESS